MTTGTWNAHKDQRFDVGELYVAGVQVAGAQATNIADLAVVFSSNDPSITPDSSVTISNGSTPTVAELQEFCVELNAKVSAIIAALEGAGISASS